VKKWFLILIVNVGCAQSLDDSASIDGGRTRDGAIEDEDTGEPGDDTGSAEDSSITPPIDSGTTITDSGTSVTDSGTILKDTGVADTGTIAKDTGPTGPITGGPCASGAAGATALRIRFYNGGGKPTVSYDVWGLPDKSRQKVGVYGYSIGYTVGPWADPYLGEGGLALDSSNFIDIELSTIGLSSIPRATLSLYGRSYNTTASGSFSWQTAKGIGATPSNSMWNSTPYRWYGGDATAYFTAGNGGTLLRIKAGPSSGSVVVNKIELCMEAS
jgi:hypothetical protein